VKRKTTPSDLKVGDRIRIIKMPGEGVPGYYLHPDTGRVFKKLIARGWAVRIARVDEYGSPWYTCRFRLRKGQWESHHLAVCDLDNNWVMVKPRDKSL
jgi:hypothetical protein